jgi:hypothetical protein
LYDTKKIMLVLGASATGLDASTRSIVIGTGVTHNRLPFRHDCANVHLLRAAGGLDRLKLNLADAHRVTVIGAGFPGATDVTRAEVKRIASREISAASAGRLVLVLPGAPRFVAAMPNTRAANGSATRAAISTGGRLGH